MVKAEMCKFITGEMKKKKINILQLSDMTGVKTTTLKPYIYVYRDRTINKVATILHALGYRLYIARDKKEKKNE